MSEKVDFPASGEGGQRTEGEPVREALERFVTACDVAEKAWLTELEARRDSGGTAPDKVRTRCANADEEETDAKYHLLRVARHWLYLMRESGCRCAAELGLGMHRGNCPNAAHGMLVAVPTPEGET